MKTFRNKYRIPSARAPWWDYSAEGRYFLTICTANREHLFGEIWDKQFKPSHIGEIVLQEWDESFVMRPNLFCDAFVLMPDHLHAIVRIDNSVVVDNGRNSDTPAVMVNGRDSDSPALLVNGQDSDTPAVETHCCASLQGFADEYQNQRENEIQNETDPGRKPTITPRRPKSVSSFIAGFKSAATKRINEFRNTPGTPVWQTRFHDRIIRDEQEFHGIREYIIDNPAKWQNDKSG